MVSLAENAQFHLFGEQMILMSFNRKLRKSLHPLSFPSDPGAAAFNSLGPAVVTR
jgi:hypothetical protein